MSEELDLDNLNMLKELLGDKFTELIDTFVSDSADRVSKITSGLATQDLQEIRHAVHGLKGSCRNIGINPLADLCQVLETQASAGQIDEGQQQLAAIEQKLAAACVDLKNLL